MVRDCDLSPWRDPLPWAGQTAGAVVAKLVTRQAAGHAHDQRAQPTRPISPPVFGQHAVAAQHGGRFWAHWRVNMREGARRDQLLIQKFEALGFGPG